MHLPGLLTTIGVSALLTAATPAVAQQYLGPVDYAGGSPVDRNVADTGANAASQRIAQPGLGQFGVGSLLLDRYAEQPFQTQHANPYANDPRVSQRYLLQAPGFTAFTGRPDYVGPSPQGGWTNRSQTIDGTEIMTLTGANTVFVLSPELLRPPVHHDASFDHPNLFVPQPVGGQQHYQIDTYIDPNRQALPTNPSLYGHKNKLGNPAQDHIQRDPNWVHPEIIERRRKLKEEREQEQREAEARQQASDESQSERKESR